MNFEPPGTVPRLVLFVAIAGTLSFLRKRANMLCWKCQGHRILICPGCTGRGYLFVRREKRLCSVCDGRGTRACEECKGEGRKMFFLQSKKPVRGLVYE
mmetsp:Transcript_80/g.172  ORF Transcript_80/g.172 Transcript_80/m.172 type:complete len:99 (+) Transcript_80:90-386(+)